MTSVFRMLFDISVYYAVTGIYLQAISGKVPFVPGFVLLCISVVAFGVFLLKDWAGKYKVLLFLLPLLCLIFQPAISQVIQLLPAWLYAGVVLTKDLGDIDLKALKSRLVKAILLLFGCLLPLVLVAQPAFRFLGNMLPYVIVMIAGAVLCFRSFHDRSGGLEHLVVVSSFTAVCTALCYLRLPQSLLTFFRDRVLLKILDALGNLFSFIRLNQLEEQKKGTGYRTELKGAAEEDPFAGRMGQFHMSETTISWLKTIFYVLLGIAIVVIAALLVVRLVKSLRQLEKPERQRAWKDQVVHIRKTDDSAGSKHRRRFGDHRMAVRYYYWRYMRECAKRGINIEKGWTAEDLASVSCDKFVREDVVAMQMLYNPVRYDAQTDVTANQAKQAAKLWQKLKRNKP